jgi:hypothetical protein
MLESAIGWRRFVAACFEAAGGGRRFVAAFFGHKDDQKGRLMASARTGLARALYLAILIGGLAAARSEAQAPQTKAQGSDPSKAAQPPAAGSSKEKAPAAFKEEELVQLTAPIALYTDDLISQILMASTYPLEVIEAHRFAETNKNLKGDALAKALNEKTWDPSVK